VAAKQIIFLKQINYLIPAPNIRSQKEALIYLPELGVALGWNPEPFPAHGNLETSWPRKEARKRDRVGSHVSYPARPLLSIKHQPLARRLSIPHSPDAAPSQNSPITRGGTLAPPARPPDRDASPPAESKKHLPRREASEAARPGVHPSKLSVCVLRPAASSGSAPAPIRGLLRPRALSKAPASRRRRRPPSTAIDRTRSTVICCCNCVYI
jgi:hypothetical protein